MCCGARSEVPFGAMLCMSILDCLFLLEGVEPIAFAGVVFAGEDFVFEEKLIFVWRFGALARLRAIVGTIRPVKANLLESCCSCAPLRDRRVEVARERNQVVRL